MKKKEIGYMFVGEEENFQILIKAYLMSFCLKVLLTKT